MAPTTKTHFMCLVLFFLFAHSSLSGCSSEKADFLDVSSPETSSEATEEVILDPVIVIVGQDANHRVVAYFDMEGNNLGRIIDYRRDSLTPRGLAPFDHQSFLVSLDGTDQIQRVFLDGSTQTFHSSIQLNGNIYDMEQDSVGNYYVIESNRIEVFDSSGNHEPTLLINTTVGSCTLSNPRGMTVNSSGNLVVTNQGGTDDVLVYDISGASPTCLSATAFGNNPYDVIEHSNGQLYIVTQGDDQVYSANADGSGATVVWPVDLTLIRDPTAILELPDGTLLVASSYTDTVERITTSGTRVGTEPFIMSPLSLNISDMMILDRNE